MWIVRLALSRPYTFVVLSILLLILGPLAILNTPVDIFPSINIPVVSVVWNYTGLSPQDMANRIVSPTERAMTTTVNGIDHLESTSLNGVSVVKVFFQPKVDIAAAVAQVCDLSDTVETTPAWDDAPSDYSVQRLKCADSATRPVGAGTIGAATQ
jgi:multidrug efflux pump subunit AcrB